MNNLPVNVFALNQAPTSTTIKNTNQAAGGQVDNFNKLLDSAVSQSNVVFPAEIEQGTMPSLNATGTKSIGPFVPDILTRLAKSGDTLLTAQIPADFAGVLNPETNSIDKTDGQPKQDLLTVVSNLVSMQMLLNLPTTVLTPTANTVDTSAITASAVNSVDAIVSPARPQFPVGLPAVQDLLEVQSSQLNAAMGSTTINQTDQNPSALKNLLQHGKEQSTLSFNAGSDVLFSENTQLSTPNMHDVAGFKHPSLQPVILVHQSDGVAEFNQSMPLVSLLAKQNDGTTGFNQSMPQNTVLANKHDGETGLDQSVLSNVVLINKTVDAINSNQPLPSNKKLSNIITPVISSQENLQSDTTEQIFAPIVTQQAKDSSRTLAETKLSDGLVSTTIGSQAKIMQEVSAESPEKNSSLTFVQGLESMVMSKRDSIAPDIATEVRQGHASADVQHVLDQIVEQTKIITKPQTTEMIIKLKPEHLGELSLRLVVENGTVSASFHSNNAEVRNIIEISAQQLKQDLANSGLKVENVSVYAGLSQFLPNHDHERSSRQQMIKFANKKSSDDFNGVIDEIGEHSRISAIAGQTGIDYRI